MIKIRRILGLTIITGTAHELRAATAMSGSELSEGDKLTVLPYKHHIHRNPRPPLLKIMEDKEAEPKRFGAPYNPTGESKELADAIEAIHKKGIEKMISDKSKADSDAEEAGV